MRLFLALCASFIFEACTYHPSINYASESISLSIGITFPQAAIITIATVSFIKLGFICALISKDKTRANLLVVLLAMCSLFDCFLTTLFLNDSLYAMLFNISELFGVIYRGVEVVCIVSIIFDVIRVCFFNTNISSDSSNRNQAGGDIRMGDKI